MKILYVTPGCFDKGGISRYNRYQISALRTIQGEESIRVISLLGPTEDGFEDEFNVFWHGNGNDIWSKLSFAYKILGVALSWKPAVIHVAHVNFSGLALLAARLCGAKVILNTYGREVWSGLRKDAEWGLRNSHYVISDCHSTADYLEKESMLRPLGSTEIIWDCVDLSRFTPGLPGAEFIKKYAIPFGQNSFIVMSLGRLSKTVSYKGYERLLNAFSDFFSQYPDSWLVFGGKGDLVPVLKCRAKELGIVERVIFTGSLPESDLADCYKSASVFSLISEQGPGKGEGIPLTPLEAMACGVPILVGNQDGSREAVDSDLNGFVLDPSDHQRLVDRLFLLASDSAQREEMSLAAIKVTKERFSYESFVEKHNDYYSVIESEL